MLSLTASFLPAGAQKGKEAVVASSVTSCKPLIGVLERGVRFMFTACWREIVNRELVFIVNPAKCFSVITAW